MEDKLKGVGVVEAVLFVEDEWEEIEKEVIVFLFEVVKKIFFLYFVVFVDK